MSKVGGNRNFGYGKKMAWAGKQALRDRYGDGHFATVAAHAARWKQFSEWVGGFGIRDARKLDKSTLERYASELGDKVRAGEKSAAYAQNLVSSVNVVLEAMRGDRQRRIAPSEKVGKRERVRSTPPAGLSRGDVRACSETLRRMGHERVAAVVEISREFGLRLREASMLNVREAIEQFEKAGEINITEGTKGGRGRRVDRWVTVPISKVDVLVRAQMVQGCGRNLIPPTLSWKQWNDHVHHVWAGVGEQFRLGKLHDLRAAYACERYESLTGHPASVVAGHRTASKEEDWAARVDIAFTLGHGRADVVAAYIGGTS